MKNFTKNELINCLKKLKIKKSSVVLIHSSLHSIGPMKGYKFNEIPKEIIKCIKEYLGPKGTILLPAFYYNYSRKKKIFNLKKSPPCFSLGSLPKYVFNNLNFYRSKHPLTSLFAIGYKASEICKKSNVKDFNKGSAWEKLTSLNANLLFLGAKPADSMTYIHYIENQVGVPHMYTKKFSTHIKDNSKIISRGCYAYVRYLDYGIEADEKNFEADLKKNKLLKEISLGSGFISNVKCLDALKFGIEKVENKSFYFLKKKPIFKKNEYPIK
ncbi:MAG: AAC(3) family N-acetyltransferase [Pelagibacteraceae bacterium]